MKLTYEDIITEDMSDRDMYDFFKPNTQYIIEIEPHEEKVLFWKETRYRLFARKIEKGE